MEENGIQFVKFKKSKRYKEAYNSFIKDSVRNFVHFYTLSRA